MKGQLLLLIIILNFNHLCLGSITTAQGSGSVEWSDPSSWNNGVPGCFDEIVIPSGITVEITSMVDLTNCAPVLITVYGELYFYTGKKLKLPYGSQVIIEEGGSIIAGGGGGSASYITIGTETVWSSSDGDITTPTVLCLDCLTPLGVSLVSFDAQCDDRTVLLNWSTTSEVNNDHYIIEKKTEGQPWKLIGYVDGAGNSNSTIKYSFADKLVSDTIIYYRLSQQDFDGVITVLNTCKVHTVNSKQLVAEYNMAGQSLKSARNGIIIKLYSDGSTKKVYHNK